MQLSVSRFSFLVTLCDLAAVKYFVFGEKEIK
jgi:hypothetical protein